MTRINGSSSRSWPRAPATRRWRGSAPVELGELVGNDYVVLKGLSAGDRLIVSGVQKIGDGAPVAVSTGTAAPAATPAPAGAAK